MVFVGIAFLVFCAIAFQLLSKAAVVVPEENVYLVERFGEFHELLRPGLHLMIPYVYRVAYKHSLKELPVDISEQICITRDNVQVDVDAILYIQIVDPQKASYGVEGYEFAMVQIVHTLIRSEIGKMDLDGTFIERSAINMRVVNELDKASKPWGVRVVRYEIQSVTPPVVILQAMENQMRAEREKRAVVLTSEGHRDAKINEAKGQAAAIGAISTATADGLRDVALSLSESGGEAAMQLRIAEQYVEQFGALAKASTTLVVPANLTDIASMVTLATGIARSR